MSQQVVLRRQRGTRTSLPMTNHPLREIWAGMMQRCFNKNKKFYESYGGRGISVCNEWTYFDVFVAAIKSEIGPRPSAKHTLDRMNTDLDYMPGNIRWADHSTQMRNQRRNRWVTHEGHKVLLIDLAVLHGINKATLYSRVCQLGWPLDVALKTSTRHYRAARSQKRQIA